MQNTELEAAQKAGINLSVDFHSLSRADVETLLELAKVAKYRTPKNANGSKARYYHARLQRLAKK